jgi:cyanate permease
MQMDEAKARKLEAEINELNTFIGALRSSIDARRSRIGSAKTLVLVALCFVGATGVIGVFMEGLRWHWAVMIGIGGLTLHHALQTEKSSTAMKQLLANTKARLDEAEDELKNETAAERLKALFTKSG